MKFRTDDEIFRARLVYLGPPNYTLPFQFTYAQYGLGAATCGISVLLGALIFGSAWAIGPAIAFGLAMAGMVWQYVDYDVPVTRVIKTLLADWKAIRSTSETEQLPRLTSSHIVYRSEIEGDHR